MESSEYKVSWLINTTVTGHSTEKSKLTEHSSTAAWHTHNRLTHSILPSSSCYGGSN